MSRKVLLWTDCFSCRFVYWNGPETLVFPIGVWLKCGRLYEKGVLGKVFRSDGEAKPVAIGKKFA